MQSILREKLLTHAIKLSEVSNIYISESHLFVAAYFAWLTESEKDLSGLRSPISILLQAEKSVLASAMDGYSPAYVLNEKSIRKKQKAIAAQSLDRISKEIHAKIESIDHLFDQLTEKLCHAVAIVASKEPELCRTLQPDQQGISLIWKKLESTPETVPMFNYFCAKLPRTDREYLLYDIIQNISHNYESHKTIASSSPTPSAQKRGAARPRGSSRATHSIDGAD
ncbi:MAG: hypothetical protein RL497_640 [Pseudomonadota bacterium]|jgi:hypothetical protein